MCVALQMGAEAACVWGAYEGFKDHHVPKYHYIPACKATSARHVNAPETPAGAIKVPE